MAASEFMVERSTTVAAPAATIYPHLVDLKAWQGWSPWEGLDPDLHRDYSANSAGAGATYAWDGNRKAGKGTMAITEATAPSKVVLDLHFLKPFKSTSQVTFDLTEAGDQTTVRWSMRGPMTTMSRIMGVFISMDKLVGKDFAKGLASLKALTEGATV